MSKRLVIGISVLVLLVAAVGGEKPFGLVGKVKSREGEKRSFIFKAKKGSYQVTWDTRTGIFRHEAAKLGELPTGCKVHVLAHRQKEQLASGGGKYPPMFVRLNCVVAGEFDPPAVPAKLSG